MGQNEQNSERYGFYSWHSTVTLGTSFTLALATTSLLENHLSSLPCCHELSWGLANTRTVKAPWTRKCYMQIVIVINVWLILFTSRTEKIFSIDIRTKINEQSKAPGLHFCSGVPCITVSALGFPVCKLKQNKKEEEKAAAHTAWFCIFPSVFWLESPQPVSAERTSKDCARCRISTKPDVYQHLSPANSLSGGFKVRGWSLSLVLGRGKHPCQVSATGVAQEHLHHP